MPTITVLDVVELTAIILTFIYVVAIHLNVVKIKQLLEKAYPEPHSQQKSESKQ